jgi:hypothetical protein
VTKFAPGVKEICQKFATGVVDTSSKFAPRVIEVSLILRCTLTCKYLCEFSKKFEIILMSFSGAWGRMIHEKNLKQKIL